MNLLKHVALASSSWAVETGTCVVRESQTCITRTLLHVTYMKSFAHVRLANNILTALRAIAHLKGFWEQMSVKIL